MPVEDNTWTTVKDIEMSTGYVKRIKDVFRKNAILGKLKKRQSVVVLWCLYAGEDEELKNSQINIPFVINEEIKKEVYIDHYTYIEKRIESASVNDFDLSVGDFILNEDGTRLQILKIETRTKEDWEFVIQKSG